MVFIGFFASKVLNNTRKRLGDFREFFVLLEDRDIMGLGSIKDFQ